MRTPQTIKDQEFEIKFRGYDAIEVKAYLELLAEDFFALTEKNSEQEEKIASLLALQETWQEEEKRLTAKVNINSEADDGHDFVNSEEYLRQEKEIGDLKAELEILEMAITTAKTKNKEDQQDIERLQNQRIGDEGKETQAQQAELDKLQIKITQLEKNNKELKQDELEFKNTIFAAQKFSESLRQSSEEEARRLIAKAHSDVEQFRLEAQAEVEKFRSTAQAELVQLSQEREELQKKKIMVREDLKKTLHAYLKTLDTVPEGGVTEEEDLDDIYKSVSSLGGVNIEDADIAKHNIDAP